MLNVVHTLIKFAQYWNVFIIEFMDVVKLAKAELFYLYTNPYFSFEELVFDAFNSLINHSSE